jgi:NAD(P)-dependent dehydrogenase (short-subunit alcohol dehydrogenase family)
MTFGAESTASEAIAGVDLRDRVAVITGASGGIGLETARAFASAGAHVVIGNRPSPKSDAAVGELRTSLPNAQIDVEALDLTSLASVREFANRVLGRHQRIDLLVNNAGVMATPFERTSDGFESQLGTNHLSHFLLTNLLTPALLAAAPARIVNLTSNGHSISDIHWDDPNYHSRPYAAWEAYGQSKTANVLFTVELQRRLGPRGVNAYAVHPGLVGTDLMRYLSDQDRAWLDSRISKSGIAYKTPQQGASTTVWAATAAQLADRGGAYVEDCHVSEQCAPYARDSEAAARLWTVSEELVGQKFPAP